MIGKLQKHLGSLVGKRVALLGLAFKPNTDDMREASSLVLARGCRPTARTSRAYDPVAEERGAQAHAGRRVRRSARSTRVDGADAVVLVTEWPEFNELDWAEVADAMAGTLVDRRAQRARRRDAVRAAGLDLRGHRAQRHARRPRSDADAGGDPRRGEGTRLRPLTSTVPKPVVPLVDRPFIAYMLEWLRGHGVDDVIMSCGFLATERPQRARRRLGLRAAPALRRGARAARHRRRAQVRRGRCSTSASSCSTATC